MARLPNCSAAAPYPQSAKMVGTAVRGRALDIVFAVADEHRMRQVGADCGEAHEGLGHDILFRTAHLVVGRSRDDVEVPE